MTDVAEPTRAEVLDKLVEYLEFERDEGMRAVEISPDLLAVMRGEIRHPERTAAAPVPTETPRPSTTPRRQTEAVRAKNPVTPPQVDSDSLDGIAGEVAGCVLCSLHKTRTRTVPGQGCSSPEVMFVGEAPGYDEDQQGLAFVGRAGQLLTKMIAAMGYSREEVFIGNIVKCRPPDNRKPLPEEMETCLPYLRRQIRILKPQAIVAMGGTAVEGLLGLTGGITRLRGKWYAFDGIPVMATFHPAYLLRTPSKKRETWEDLQAVVHHLGREIPEWAGKSR